MQLTTGKIRTGAGPLRSAIARRREEVSSREDGNLIVVLILIVALTIVSLVAVGAVVGGVSVANSTTYGSQAVAQVNAGVSDALYHLDQMGDNVQSYCVGTPPAGVSRPAGVSSCLPGLADAPSLVYYAVTRQSSTAVQVAAFAKQNNEIRIAHVTIFRILDNFGIYGLSNLTWNGNFSKAVFNEVDSHGKSVNTVGTINIGVGAGGTVSCGNGGTNGNVKVIGQPGSTLNRCVGSVISGSTITPQAATVCASGVYSVAFAPCLDTSSFAVEPAGAPNPGAKYCPLPASSTLTLAAGIYSYIPASPSPTAVYDCDTSGTAVTIASTKTDTILPGSYYFTGNAATIGALSYQSLSAQTNFWVIPANCATSSCAPATPTSTSPTSGCNSTSPPGTSLTLSGLVNYNTSGNNNPDLAIYWGGCGSVYVGSGNNAAEVTAYLYLPGGVISSNGGKFVLDGQMVIGTFTVNGAPNFSFVFPEHQTQVLQGWTKTDYRISA